MFSGLKGTLFGRQTDAGGLPEEIKDLRNISARVQTRGIQELEKDIGKISSGQFRSEAGQLARRQTEEAARAARTGYDDAIRSLQQKIAQRGLQRSSIGLMGEVGLQRDLSNQLGGIRAGEAALGEDIFQQKRRQAILDALSGGQGSLNVASRFDPMPRKYSGGIFKPLMTAQGALGGGIIGLATGNPAGGAQAGAQFGSAFGDVGQGAFGPR